MQLNSKIPMIAKQKNMTIDDLAAMMNREFERFQKKMEDGFDGVRTDLKADFKKEIDRLDQRLGKLEFKLDELKDMITYIQDVDILNLQKRVKELEQELKIIKKRIALR